MDGGDTPQAVNPAGSGNTMTFSDASFEANGGTLLLNNSSKLSGVTLNGGMFGSAGQKLQISKLNLNGGKLLFDFSMAQNASSLELAFDSAADFSDAITQSDFAFAAIDDVKYLLISFADSSMNSKLQEIIDSNSNGKYLFTDAATSDSFYATFSAENGAFYVRRVPERWRERWHFRPSYLQKFWAETAHWAKSTKLSRDSPAA